MNRSSLIFSVIVITSLYLCLGVEGSQAANNQIQELKETIKQAPDNKEALTKLGDLLLKQKDFDAAVDAYRKAIVESDPNSYLKLARAYRIQRKFLDEIRVLNLMIPKHPNYPRGHVLLANAYIQVDRLDDAITRFRRAIELAPRYEAAHWGLYKVYEKKDNNYESRIILLDMVRLFGEKPMFLNPLCKLYSIDSFFDDAIAFCQRAIQKDPSYPDNHIHLALTYKYAKNKQQAERIIKTAASQFSKSEFAQKTAGEITTENENWEEATKYFRSCVGINDKNLDCQMGLAKATFNIGRYEDANKAFLAACKIDRKTVTEYKRSAAVLRINKKSEWHKKFTDSIRQCY